MIESISSSTNMTLMQTSSGTRSNYTLSSDQLEVISSTLSKYDSSNLSSDDALSIVEAFGEAGIRPSEALSKAMASEGFDAKEVGDLAGVGGSQGAGGMPPPPPIGKQEESDVTDLLDSLLTIEKEDDLETTNSSFSDIMEYTSRILNLNESSKTEVMDMLTSYASSKNGFSDNEISNIVKNSLGTILGEPDNYNRYSIYA